MKPQRLELQKHLVGLCRDTKPLVQRTDLGSREIAHSSLGTELTGLEGLDECRVKIHAELLSNGCAGSASD